METKQKRKKIVVSVLALAGLLVFSLFAMGGSLEPSGPPGPTMKTLDEVEPRIPIRAADLPLTVTEPNSYYLVEDVNFTNTMSNAITIECNDVTIDLMGYSLIGPGTNSGHGIFQPSTYQNLFVSNGTIKGWKAPGKYAIRAEGKCNRIRNINASDSSNGIYSGSGTLILECTVHSIVGPFYAACYGIYCEKGSNVLRCQVSELQAGWDGSGIGILAKEGSNVIECSVYYVRGGGITDGIRAFKSTISKCSAQECNNGIRGYSCTMTECTACNNLYAGILPGDGSIATRCVANHNSGNAGIYVLGSDNCVDGNQAVGNTGKGIYASQGGNIIIRNTARANGTNYSIGAGNAYGQIINVAGTGSFINTDPTANFQF